MEHKAAVDPLHSRWHNSRWLVRLGIGGVAAVLLAGTVTGCAAKTAVTLESNRSAATVGRPASVDAAVASSSPSCSTSATVSAAAGANPTADAARQRVYPPAQSPSAGAAPMTRTQAVTAADMAVQGGSSASNGSATEMSYGSLIARASTYLSADRLISPTRCVWVVTVHAPFTIPTPYGHAPETASVYNVVFDAGTSAHMSTVAGVDLGG